MTVIGPIEVDNRRRISLAKAGVQENARFIIEKDLDGTIHLIPLTSIPIRELSLLSDTAFMKEWRASVEAAESNENGDRES